MYIVQDTCNDIRPHAILDSIFEFIASHQDSEARRSKSQMYTEILTLRGEVASLREQMIVDNEVTTEIIALRGEVSSLKEQLSVKNESTTVMLALHGEVISLKEMLTVSQNESNNRYKIIECLCYVTNLERCEICYESLANRDMTWILQTACDHSVCLGCWKKHNDASAKRGVRLRCPWNSCILQDKKGEVVYEHGLSVVKNCRISFKYSKNHLIEAMETVFELLKQHFEHKIIPNPFDRHIPELLAHYVNTGQVKEFADNDD